MLQSQLNEELTEEYLLKKIKNLIEKVLKKI